MTKAPGTCWGDLEQLAPAIGGTGPDRDQAVTLQRQDVPSESCPVHDEIRSKSVDGHGPQPPQSREYRKLRRAQPAWCQKLIVKLRDVPGSLADGEAVAVIRP